MPPFIPDFSWRWLHQLSYMVWYSTWYAPCNDVTTPGKEFSSIQVRKGTSDRLISTSVQPPKLGNAMRVEVKSGDVAVNPYNGLDIASGWRAEAVGPFEDEDQGFRNIRYTWSTKLDPAYVADPRDANGQRIWQVIFQWHQRDVIVRTDGGRDGDCGGPPPIAFTIVGDYIMLDFHKHDPADDAKSIKVGEWPIAPLDRCNWHDFTAEIRWHRTQGSIKVWHNGSRVTFNPYGPTAYPPQPTITLTGLETLFPPLSTSTKPPTAYMKVGLYRKGVDSNPPGPFILYHDEVTRWERWAILLPILKLTGALMSRIRLPKFPPFPRPPGPESPPPPPPVTESPA
jgi:Polysaccharide lyase